MHRTLLLLSLSLTTSPCWAATTRAILHSDSTPDTTLMGQIIDSSAFVADTNVFTGTNNFYGSTLLAIPAFTKSPNITAALPTITSCGNTPPAATAGSNASAGSFTLGTSTPTACTVTFATAYPTTSFCTVTPASSGGAAISGGFYLSANDKTGFTLTIGTGTNSLVFNYTCFGN